MIQFKIMFYTAHIDELQVSDQTVYISAFTLLVYKFTKRIETRSWTKLFFRLKSRELI